jgi:hypothetical protein
MAMKKPEKLTLVLTPQTKDALVTWATEEDRPVANLLRKIVGRALAERQQQSGGAAA